MTEISILLVGNTDRPEFRRARAVLDASGRVTCLPDPESAAAALAEGRVVPEVIVVAQAYPAQFSSRVIDRLQRLAPLGRVLGLLGSWCEGEMRSGKPWPGAVRLYWHQWPPRCRRQIERIRRGECSAWGLPVTATEEERLLLTAGEPTPNRQGLIAIHTPSFVMEDWLSAACRSRGLSTVWLRPPRWTRVEGATAAIFDGSDGRGWELEAIERLWATLAPAPVIVLLDFPRIEDHHRVLAAGAAAVVSKPLNVDDLFAEMDHHSSTSARKISRFHSSSCTGQPWIVRGPS